MTKFTADKKRIGLTLGLSVIFALLFFLFDLLEPLGVAAGVPYVALVLIGLITRQPRMVLALATVGTVLAIIGYLLSPVALVPRMVALTNLGLAIFAIWATALVSYVHLRSLATLKPLVNRDELTGLFNRYYFNIEAPRQIQISRRYSHPLAMIMIDIDHFKDVNDRWGHLAGDLVLQTLAQTLRSHTREIDIVCRYGGEEFVILLPFTSLRGAESSARQLHRIIGQLEVAWEQTRITFTVSMGVAELKAEQKDIDQLVAAADEALYEAKNSGRNCVKVAS